MSRFEAVLFDMDGVLVDSEPFWQEFWREEVFADAEDGDPGLGEVTGRNFRESLAELDETYGLPGGPEPYERRFEATRERVYGEEVTVTPGVPELFDALRERGLKVAIVSSSPRSWIEQVVGRFDLAVDAVVSADELAGPGKPEPLVYERAASEVGVDPERCVVVEDSEHGVAAASAAGCTVVRFVRGEAVTDAAGADYLADDPEELRERVFELVRSGERDETGEDEHRN